MMASAHLHAGNIAAAPRLLLLLYIQQRLAASRKRFITCAILSDFGTIHDWWTEPHPWPGLT
jgi:hypothetical protein|tara:strand:- start:795 stop:980 length:186 start_codon:yes stop_codon:yes gene_type:complete